MKNENCLKGLMCPECGHTEDFVIGVQTQAYVTDDGAVLARQADMEWDGSSTAWCGKCRHMATVADFTIPGFRVTFEIYTDLGYEMGEPDRRGWWMPGEWLYDECPDELAFEFDPADYDPDEHESLADAIVEWAVATLRNEGAVHPNESPSDHADWWSTEDEVHDYATGAKIALAFHFERFSDEIQVKVNQELAS